jgi:WD40 repeat protein
MEMSDQWATLEMGSQQARYSLFSPDGKLLAVWTDNNAIWIWDVETRQKLAELPGQVTEITALAFSLDSQSLATVDSTTSIRLWEAYTGKLISAVTLPINGENVESISFSPDLQLVATGMDDWVAHVWETTSGRQISTVEPSNPRSAGGSFPVFLTKNKQFIITEGDQIDVWEVLTGRRVTQFSGSSVVVSPNGRWLATLNLSSNGPVEVWDTSTWRRRMTLPEYYGYDNQLTFSDDDAWMITAGDPYIVRIWDVTTGSLISQLPEQQDKIFSATVGPGHKWLAIETKHGCLVYKALSFMPVEELRALADYLVRRELTVSEQTQYMHK